MSNQSIIEKAAAHLKAEASQDIDGLMATFHSDAFCELRPVGYNVASKVAIEALYRRSFPILSRALSDGRKTNEWYNDKGLSAEWEFTLTKESGQQVKAKRVTILEYDGDLIKSKRLYMDRAFADLVLSALGEDFASLPDVEKLGK